MGQGLISFEKCSPHVEKGWQCGQWSWWHLKPHNSGSHSALSPSPLVEKGWQCGQWSWWQLEPHNGGSHSALSRRRVRCDVAAIRSGRRCHGADLWQLVKKKVGQLGCVGNKTLHVYFTTHGEIFSPSCTPNRNQIIFFN